MKDELNSEAVYELPPRDLQLDTQNPRFAGELGEHPSQVAILDFIAETIGIADLLSSMSKRGYHRANPLIAVKEGDSYTVVEGNRRLATALILTDDERSVNQKARARNYDVTPTARALLERLPVLIASNRREILPYLGIAHIVGNKKWDSYAKAAWAADVQDKEIYGGGLREIADEIGDKHRTLERLVEAFRMVKQLEAAGLFIPDDTMRSGKGIAKFPFSWVYTALGYKSIREWLGIDAAGTRDGTTYARADIVPAESLSRAAELLDWLFGSRSRGQKPRIEESRQISDIAASVLSEKRVALLKRGLSIDEVQRESQPAHERMMSAFVTAEQALREILGLLGAEGGNIPAPQVQPLITESQTVAKAAINVNKQLRTLAEPEFDEQLV
jgi:hypothetical protein